MNMYRGMIVSAVMVAIILVWMGEGGLFAMGGSCVIICRWGDGKLCILCLTQTFVKM